MTTFLAISGLLFIIAVLWIFCDTITKKLSEGKSFATNETTWK